ncbi:MAG: inositol monophosphatase [Alphaproteobacteria bacterium]|nr:inositol monophosphatase [Alphaproteobacteria bacterium]
MKDVDIQQVTALIRETARKYILPRFKMLKDHEISTKTGPRDLVTQADIEAENYFNIYLPKILPGSFVLGEEGVSGGAVGIELLQNLEDDLWVVDPVDGTYNFVHGKEEFAVMIALVSGGETRNAWIYDVPADKMTLAQTGAGAFTEGTKLTTAPQAQTSTMTGYISPRFFPDFYQDHLANARSRFLSCAPLGCAGHEYLRIASGAAQFSIYSRLKPWDHLPGALIVKEAGGYVAKWDGQTYTPQDYNLGLIVAANQENWEDIYRIFITDQGLGE